MARQVAQLEEHSRWEGSKVTMLGFREPLVRQSALRGYDRFRRVCRTKPALASTLAWVVQVSCARIRGDKGDRAPKCPQNVAPRASFPLPHSALPLSPPSPLRGQIGSRILTRLSFEETNHHDNGQEPARSELGLARARNVFSRDERIERLRAADRWKEGDSPFGLAKVRVFKLAMKKKKKKKEEEEAGRKARRRRTCRRGGKEGSSPKELARSGQEEIAGVSGWPVDDRPARSRQQRQPNGRHRGLMTPCGCTWNMAGRAGSEFPTGTWSSASYRPACNPCRSGSRRAAKPGAAHRHAAAGRTGARPPRRLRRHQRHHPPGAQRAASPALLRNVEPAAFRETRY